MLTMPAEWTAVLLGIAVVSLLLVVLGLRQVVFRRLADRSIRDPETGVYTADFIQEVYQSELRRAERTGVPFSLALVTPHLPPATGPTAVPMNGVAPSVAHWLQQHLRGSDYVGRLENNRFVVILPETWEDDARSVAARITSAFQFKGHSGKWLSCDIGIATWRPEATDVWNTAEQQLGRAGVATQN
jgi:GGDEF domain-containing protein